MSAIDDAAAALGVELLPWQRKIARRFLNGDRIVIIRGRPQGWSTLERVVEKAQELSACRDEVNAESLTGDAIG